MIKMSSGLKGFLLATGSVKQAFDGGHIDVYSGEQPVNPDQPPNGTKLGSIDAEGVSYSNLTLFYISAYNTLTHVPGERLILTPTAIGTAGWWRFKPYSPVDTDEASTTALRIDGTVGVDLHLQTESLVTGEIQVVDSLSLLFYTDISEVITNGS